MIARNGCRRRDWIATTSTAEAAMKISAWTKGMTDTNIGPPAAEQYSE
jgi:hypothetical protein